MAQIAATWCTCYCTLQYTVVHHTISHCDVLQHTATHCNTLQHTATHCNTLHHAATHCNTLLHTVTHCYTLQHPNHPFYIASIARNRRREFNAKHIATHCNTLQHTATLCNTHITHSTSLPLPEIGAENSMTRAPGLFAIAPPYPACCSVLQCVAVRCSVMQCHAVCCSVLQYVAAPCLAQGIVASECCSVLQWLQCVAVCYSAL